MLNKYFQQELTHLRDLGAEFSKMHPAVAPMLSGMSTDPDAERLLEGVAFLTALLRRRLDDDFPEIIQELFQLIWPHYLRPLPASTIVAFTPAANLKQTVQVPRGTQLASEPVEGTPCLFQTSYDVDVHPLVLEKAAFEEKPGQPACIRLMLTLQGVGLDEWQPEKLRIYLTGNPKQAADLYMLLCRYVQKIVLTPSDQGDACVLPPEHIHPVGFGSDDALLVYPPQSFPGYRVIQEYFILPEKFLFIDLEGFDQWRHRGNGEHFEIRFELRDPPLAPPRVRTESFALAATPATNLFTHDADPIRLDHRKTEYGVRPSGGDIGHYQVYDIARVTGFVQGTAKERNYVPFEMFSPNPDAAPTYHVHIRPAPVHHGTDFHLSVAYPPGAGSPSPETLSIQLQCTNGRLPEALQVGDIRHPTSDTPEFVEFINLRPPTPSILPTPGHNLHWKLLSHLCLNYHSLADTENLQALLSLYNFEENRDRPAFLANQNKIAGIQAVRTRAADRLVQRVIMRGREILLDLRQDHFAGPGDLFLFGSILDHFFGLYASMNTFTQLVIKEVLKGEVYRWPERIGDHPLI